jgi:hypothetical protein
MNQTPRNRSLVTLLELGVAAILILIPFHATLTVWAGSNFGHYTGIRLWPEYLLAVLGTATAIIFFQDHKLRSQILKSWLGLFVIAYILLSLLIGVIARGNNQVNTKALVYGLVINLRPMLFFTVCYIAAKQSKRLHLEWKKLLLIPASIVVFFGLLQHFFLPANFLSHLGYGPHTITPYETVDKNSKYIRLQSTLRGPNPLGAYLVIIITALIILFNYVRNINKRVYLLIFSLASLVVLFFSYSRSALVGVILSLVIGTWFFYMKSPKKWLAAGLVGALILIGGISYLSLRHNIRFENTFLHTSTQTHSSVSSNENHESALKSGIKDIIHQPLGRGVGTAGPASVYNNHPARIAEDYYVQLGQEVGVIGLALFIAINVVIAKILYDNRKDRLALILLCSLVGISFVNLLSHAWGDDTLAYIWWGFAGIAAAPGILKAREFSHHENAKTKKEKTF